MYVHMMFDSSANLEIKNIYLASFKAGQFQKFYNHVPKIYKIGPRVSKTKGFISYWPLTPYDSNVIVALLMNHFHWLLLNHFNRPSKKVCLMDSPESLE